MLLVHIYNKFITQTNNDTTTLCVACFHFRHNLLVVTTSMGKYFFFMLNRMTNQLIP